MTLNKSKELLLEMKNIHIDGFSDERWHKILKGVDLTLHRGEILGLIGESGAGNLLWVKLQWAIPNQVVRL